MTDLTASVPCPVCEEPLPLGLTLGALTPDPDDEGRVTATLKADGMTALRAHLETHAPPVDLVPRDDLEPAEAV